MAGSMVARPASPVGTAEQLEQIGSKLGAATVFRTLVWYSGFVRVCAPNVHTDSPSSGWMSMTILSLSDLIIPSATRSINPPVSSPVKKRYPGLAPFATIKYGVPGTVTVDLSLWCRHLACSVQPGRPHHNKTTVPVLRIAQVLSYDLMPYQSRKNFASWMELPYACRIRNGR